MTDKTGGSRVSKNPGLFWRLTVTALLTVQLGLLWLHGSLLNRQRAELVALGLEIRRLAAALDTVTDYGGGPPPPSSAAGRRPPGGFAPAMMQDDDGDGERGERAARMEMEESRRSAREAVQKAKEAQEKVSIAENARKAAEKAEIEKERKKWHRLLGLALLVGAVAYFAGARLKNRK